MTAPANDNTPEVLRQLRFVESLQLTVYSQPDPAAMPDLLQQLAEAERELRLLRRPPPDVTPTAPSGEPAPLRPGLLLGPETTGLRVTPTVNMHPLPTGIYHLLDPDTDPLLTVKVGNVSTDRRPRRVCIKAFIEGLSAEAVRTIEIERGKDVTLG